MRSSTPNAPAETTPAVVEPREQTLDEKVEECLTALTRKQVRFLELAVEKDRAGKVWTQKEIADAVPCSEAIVCTWKKQAKFRRAVKVLLYDDSDTLGLRATVASLGRAIRGSIKDYELYLQRTGQLPHLLPRVLVGGAAATAGAGANATTTVIFQGVPPPVEPLTVLPPADPTRATTIVPAPPHL